MNVIVKVPVLMENIKEANVANLLVKTGEEVTEGQDLLELETDKATTPIPAPKAGKIVKIHVSEKQDVAVGQNLLTIQAEGTESSEEQEDLPQESEPDTPTTPPVAQVAPVSQQTAPVAPQATPAQRTTQQLQKMDPKLIEAGLELAASPTVRRIANWLEIDLNRVSGSGRGNRITLDDLKAHVHSLQFQVDSFNQAPAAPSSPQPPAQTDPLPDFSKWGHVRKEETTFLRNKIAEKMVQSWTTIPLVTQYDEANISSLATIVKKYSAAYKKEGSKLTITVLILKALTKLLKNHPKFNASIDIPNKRIIFKEYINLGIAVDTPQGLIVPVIKDAQNKSVLELANELQTLAEKARARKVSIDDLQGGSFTISNQGGIGGGTFTPIVNYPEVAILGIARAIKKPIVSKKSDKVEIGLMMPIAISYDHRLIDGADAARFISEFVNALEQFDEKEIKLS